ncbi:MAG: tetratricopeptide repeat protein [Burkholderiaceae bacterium]
MPSARHAFRWMFAFVSIAAAGASQGAATAIPETPASGASGATASGSASPLDCHHHSINDFIETMIAPLSNEALRARADAGDPMAQDEMGRRTGTGSHAMARDSQASFDWYLKAARQGLCTAESNLAYMYLNGEGVDKDVATAARWYRIAADDGETRAMYALGWMAHHAIGQPFDGALAVAWYRAAAEHGDYLGQLALGHALADARMAPRIDNGESAFWLGMAHGWETHGDRAHHVSPHPAPLPDRPVAQPRPAN